MARTSRKIKTPAEVKIISTDEVLAGLYVRLSVEDNGKEGTESIENQRATLNHYVESRPYIHVVEVYEDNGYTGTDFERPAFNRMLQDARKGKINCIIVKDFSRLGRNYLDTGDYLEKVFPFLGIRFISISDNYDSSSATANEMLGVSLKNVINDMYARDISKKVCSAMKAKRVKGDYIGNYAPYGYIKDPANKNKLLIDYEIAPIVVEMFELRAEGKGISAICRILDEKGYPSPGRLRYERGIITNNNQKGSSLPWNRRVLNDLLHNVVYIGHLEQGRSGQCLHKGIKFHWTDPSEWDFVANTHQPIISQELWDRVQRVNQAKTSAAKESHGKYSHLEKRENPYSGVLKCADCGRVLKLVSSYGKPTKSGEVKIYYTYKCPENIEHGDKGCPKKSIRADDLDAIILELFKKQMQIYADSQRLLKKLLAIERSYMSQRTSPARIANIRTELSKQREMSAALYTDYKEGLLGKEEYVYAKKKYQQSIDQLEQELRELQVIKENTIERSMGEKHWAKIIADFSKAQSVTRSMVEAMVEEIFLNSDNEVSIKFNYVNEFDEIMQECKRIEEVVA